MVLLCIHEHSKQQRQVRRDGRLVVGRSNTNVCAKENQKTLERWSKIICDKENQKTPGDSHKAKQTDSTTISNR